MQTVEVDLNGQAVALCRIYVTLVGFISCSFVNDRNVDVSRPGRDGTSRRPCTSHDLLALPGKEYTEFVAKIVLEVY